MKEYSKLLFDGEIVAETKFFLRTFRSDVKITLPFA